MLRDGLWCHFVPPMQRSRLFKLFIVMNFVMYYTHFEIHFEFWLNLYNSIDSNKFIKIYIFTQETKTKNMIHAESSNNYQKFY